MTRHGMARLGLASLLLVGCGASHGRDDDGGVDAGATTLDGSAPPVDAGRRDAGGSAGDAGRVDAGAPGACEAQRAQAATCPEALCDGPSSWHWNGDDCFEVDCGACRGEDCDEAWFSRDACLAAHASCEPARCRASGGTWRFWGEDCGHFVCGVAPPAICEVGTPSCDCGPMQIFDAEEGCVFDVGCTMGPPMRDPEVACTDTGGSWEGICCHAECGVPCGDACVNPACNCGPGRVFDEQRGCVDSAICYEGRRLDETCEDGARCAFGLICCQSCGGAGCFGPPTCRAPVCDDDPTFDECGNNLLAP